eukprot:1886781-Amphidinium_carterae.2
MTVLLNWLRRAVQNHLLLNIDMTKPDFDKTAKVVEDYYRNFYIENDYTTNTNVFKGKRYGKGKGNDSFKGQDRNSYDRGGKKG